MMTIDIVEKKPALPTWDNITYPWVGVDKNDGQTILFYEYGKGISLKDVVSSHPNGGRYLTCWNMNYFIPVPANTEITLTFK